MSDAETRALGRAAVLLLLASTLRWGWRAAGAAPLGPDTEDALPELLERSRVAVADAEERARPLGKGERLDPNRATAAQLDRLPGIGPATADAIVASREREGPFSRAEDLARVRGLGPAALGRIRGQLDFSRAPPRGPCPEGAGPALGRRAAAGGHDAQASVRARAGGRQSGRRGCPPDPAGHRSVAGAQDRRGQAGAALPVGRGSHARARNRAGHRRPTRWACDGGEVRPAAGGAEFWKKFSCTAWEPFRIVDIGEEPLRSPSPEGSALSMSAKVAQEIRLGDLFVREGLITDQQLQEALADAKTSGTRIGYCAGQARLRGGGGADAYAGQAIPRPGRRPRQGFRRREDPEADRSPRSPINIWFCPSVGWVGC